MTTDKLKQKEQSEEAAIAAKRKNKKKKKDEITTLTSGIRVRFRPVASNVIRDAQLGILDPVIPMKVHPEDNSRMMEWPADENYQIAVQETTIAKERAAMDAMLLCGIDLVDPIPDDRRWLDRQVFLKTMTQEQADLCTPDSLHLELYYKKYVVADAVVLVKVSRAAGISVPEEDVDKARESFQRNKK